MKGSIDKIFNDRSVSFDYFGVSKGREAIANNNFPQHFFPIVALFSEDCNYNITELYTHFGRLFIKGDSNGVQSELLLRYQGGKNLIVAVVCFVDRRNGKMSKLFEYLKKINEDYGFVKIVVESAYTDAMKNWCTKNGFVESVCIENNYEYYSRG